MPSYLPKASAPSSLALGSILVHKALMLALSFAERLIVALEFQKVREKCGSEKATEVDLV